jgi:hypothetical protein
MLLECRSNLYVSRSNAIFRGRKEFDRSDLLEVGSQYIGYGLFWKSDRLEVLVDRGGSEGSSLVSANVEIFDIVDSRIPLDWHFAKVGQLEGGFDASIDRPPEEDPEIVFPYYDLDAIMGYYDLVHRPVHLPGLIYGNREELVILLEVSRRLSRFHR